MTKHRLRTAAALFGGAALAATLTGCHVGAQSDKGFGDAPVGAQLKGPAEVINMPDTYPNIVDKCDGHGHRVYVNNRSSGQYFVVIADPSCR